MVDHTNTQNDINTTLLNQFQKLEQNMEQSSKSNHCKFWWIYVIVLCAWFVFGFVMIVSLKEDIRRLQYSVAVLENMILQSHAEHKAGSTQGRTKRSIDDSESTRELVEMLTPEHVEPNHRVNNMRHVPVAAHIYGVPDYDKRTCDSIQWFESNWMSRISSTHGFLKSKEGIIVRRSGLYYIYAQLYYYGSRNLAGYSVRQNDTEIMTCAVSDITKSAETKTNSCHVSSIAYLQKGDVLSIKNHHNAGCITHPDKVFYGAFKIAEI